MGNLSLRRPRKAQQRQTTTKHRDQPCRLLRPMMVAVSLTFSGELVVGVMVVLPWGGDRQVGRELRKVLSASNG